MTGISEPRPPEKMPIPTRVEVERSQFNPEVIFAWFFVGEKQYTGFWCSDMDEMEPRFVELLIPALEELK